MTTRGPRPAGSPRTSAERGLGVWTYPLFRPRLGIMSCGIYVWDTGGEEIWQLPYYRMFWHLPFPSDQRLTRLALSNSLSTRASSR